MTTQQENHNTAGGNQTVVHLGASTALAGVASIFSLLAFGAVIAACILIPEIIDSRSRAAAVASQLSERESRIAVDQVQTMRIELAKKGIFIQLDDHQ